MDVIAIIPARGGSVGFPGKNKKPLGGVPLVGRAVSAACGATGVSSVYVTSDDETILDIARSFGATGIRRPDTLSGPTASSESALLHALEHLRAEGRNQPDVLIFLQCTSPFTTAAEIDAVLSAMEAQKADSAFAVVEDHGFIWSVGPDGRAIGVTHNESQPRQRRQDMTPRYRETGAIYAMRVASFLASGSRFCGRSILVPLETPAIEIDTPGDWRIAEAYLRSRPAPDIEPRLQRLKAVITDFDGVHTDDLVIVHQDGTESVHCSRSDGFGVEMMAQRGLKLLILSREENPVVIARARKLRMEVIHHVKEKLSALDAWRQANGFDWDNMAYVGNDVTDITCMRACGLGLAPMDAHPEVLAIADFVLGRPGGRGALRELSALFEGL